MRCVFVCVVLWCHCVIDNVCLCVYVLVCCCVGVSVCLYMCLSVCLCLRFVYLGACMFTCMCMCMCVSACLCAFVFVCGGPAGDSAGDSARHTGGRHKQFGRTVRLLLLILAVRRGPRIHFRTFFPSLKGTVGEKKMEMEISTFSRGNLEASIHEASAPQAPKPPSTPQHLACKRLFRKVGFRNTSRRTY